MRFQSRPLHSNIIYWILIWVPSERPLTPATTEPSATPMTEQTHRDSSTKTTIACPNLHDRATRQLLPDTLPLINARPCT